MKPTIQLIVGLTCACLAIAACSGSTDTGGGNSGGQAGVNFADAGATGGHSGNTTGGGLAIGGSSNAAQGGTNGAATGGTSGGVSCGTFSCSLSQFCSNSSCGICGPAGGPCPTIACATGGAGNGNSTLGQTCTLTNDCSSRLLCCYPCGTAGCTNQCMQPGPSGVCPTRG